MISVCFYFEVHQPFRLRPYHFFDIGHSPFYLDSDKNAEIVRKVAEKCYLPTTALLHDLIRKHGSDFRFTFSITGTAVEQFRMWAPKVLESFRRLADTGHVEFLGETYYHSLASLVSEAEFRAQVEMHRVMILKEFGVQPTAFRNTELIYSNHIAWLAHDLGFKTILLEGAEKILGWRSPNFVYRPKYTPDIKCMLKNYKLSDDIAFRFSQKSWKEHPLTAEKFAKWVHQTAGNGRVVNLFMDFETFGEHQWEDSGIFEFMREMPERVMRHGDFKFRTVSDAAAMSDSVGEIDTNDPVSWADVERDVSAWIGNSIQRQALGAIYELESLAHDTADPDIIDIYRKLQTSDHFYYMCTKYFSDGDVHKYFSPYNSPYDAYIYYMNVLQDFRQRLKVKMKERYLLPGHTEAKNTDLLVMEM